MGTEELKAAALAQGDREELLQILCKITTLPERNLKRVDSTLFHEAARLSPVL